MRGLNLCSFCLRIVACCMAVLATGCSSLQIDVDVYKGPLTHERYIQVRQYASMASAAKPLIMDMEQKILQYEEEDLKLLKEKKLPALTARRTIRDRRVRLVCEILEFYRTANPDDQICRSPLQLAKDQGGEPKAKSLSDAYLARGKRPRPNPNDGLDYLTSSVAEALNNSSGDDRQSEINSAVDRLSEALILFAQKLVYLTNNELLFANESQERLEQLIRARKSGDVTITDLLELHVSNVSEDNRWKNSISVLQALGNTILVHANDLRRQTARDELHAHQSASLNGAVQKAFQPEPSATVDGILYRLSRFSLEPTSDTVDIDSLDTATPLQKKAVEDSEKALKEFKGENAALLAAYCTLFICVPAELEGALKCGPSISTVVNDHNAIQALFAGPHATQADGLQSLSDWLSAQVPEGVSPKTDRLVRLAAFKEYLVSEKERLRVGGIVDKTTRAQALTILKSHLEMNVEEARNTTVQLEAEVDRTRALITGQNEREAAHLAQLARQAKATKDETMREQMTRVVRTYRSAVIGEAEALGNRDPQVITAMLLRNMKKAMESSAKAKPDEPKREELELTIAVVEKFTVPKTPCHVSVHSAQCNGQTAIEVLDNLIAELRAQHVQAIAAGHEVAAVNLLKAVNAAYDQRTAMIYLRPASDYLRSVYAATTLQDGAENEERNMLAGWIRKLGGGAFIGSDSAEKIKSKRELDKINWQNVNKVTLSGGGSTNYVIAKDDVGNWYVKAYGSDPDAIIKSATSLALFNAGKGVSVNLLRRADAQRRLDEDKSISESERTALLKEAGAVNPANSDALLKVRDRYAARYVQETLTQAADLLATMTAMPTKASARLKEVTSWPEGCTAATADDLLKPLDGTYLATPRERLAATVKQADALAKVNATMLVQMEQNIQAVLTAMHLYGRAVLPALKLGKGMTCDAVDQAAKHVLDDVREQIVSAAKARRSSIERYEDVLTGVLDIASEK